MMVKHFLECRNVLQGVGKQSCVKIFLKHGHQEQGVQSQGFLSKSRKIIRAPAAARQYYKGHPLRRLTEGSSEIEMSLDGCSLPLPSNEVVSWVFSTGDTYTLQSTGRRALLASYLPFWQLWYGSHLKDKKFYKCHYP